MHKMVYSLLTINKALQNPNIVRAISMPSASNDVIAVVTQDGLNLYTMQTGQRYPHWNQVPLTNVTGSISDCQLFLTSTNVLNIAVMSGDSVFIADPSTVAMDGWQEDTGVRGTFGASISSFAVLQGLGSSVNHSKFGYAVASATQGLGFLTGGSFSIRNPSILVGKTCLTYLKYFSPS